MDFVNLRSHMRMPERNFGSGRGSIKGYWLGQLVVSSKAVSRVPESFWCVSFLGSARRSLSKANLKLLCTQGLAALERNVGIMSVGERVTQAWRWWLL